MAYQKVEIEFNGQPLTMETGKMARQADGAVVITYGERQEKCGKGRVSFP
jgi:polyribonucleotide nucleotidyltransferase